MKTRKFWLLYGSLSLILALLLACGASVTSTPTPTATPAPSPAPAPIPEPKPSPTLVPSATVKATPTEAPVSFAGKTITIVVPFTAGAANDIVARVYAKFLGKYLPGKPAVIVRNMPGGSGTIGPNYTYSAKPDGQTMLITGGSTPLNQLTGLKAVNYDLLKMPAIIGTNASAIFYTKPGVIDKPEDIVQAKGLVYGGAPGGQGYFFITAKEVLGFPMDRVIVAYPGSADSRRAFLAGEINITNDITPAYTSTVSLWAKQREVILLFQAGQLTETGDVVRDPAFPATVETVNELHVKIYGKPPSGIAWDAFKAVLASYVYNYLLVLAPGTPDSIARVFWTAGQNMVKDAEFRALVMPVVGEAAGWNGGQSYDKEFKLNFNVAAEVRNWLRSTLPKYGIVVE